MPTDGTNHNVVGTDGIKPSYNPEGLWKTWAISEIYTGGPGSNRYVPKVLDHVVEPSTNTRYKVNSLSQVTLIPELVPLGSNNSLALSSQDLLFATGPGWPSQCYRIFLDDTVFPYRLDVDAFTWIRQVNAAYVKIIHGSLYGDHQIVSQVFDASGTFITDQVGLDLAAVEPGWTNYHIKTVKTCNCSQKFVNGDVLTVIIYSADGHVLGITPLSVVNSNFIRALNAPQKSITHTSLRSPFLSETNPNLLLLPLNWTTATMNLTGVVHYSNGDEVEIPVDGRKFTMQGLQQLLSSIPNHEMDMVLHYSLDPTETTTHETSSFNNGINTPYRVRLVDPNYSYSVRLYAFPVWDEIGQQFQLTFWMFNLERNIYRNVTGSVRFAANSPLFDGSSYGVVQRFQVTLNLRDVIPTYKAFAHTQVFEVSLYGTPTDFPTPWIVRHNLSDALPYGGALYALLGGNGSVNLSSGIQTFEEWKDRVYLKSYPLTETPEDPSAIIQPTHFDVLFNGQTTTFPIDQWNQNLVLSSPGTVRKSVHIVFKRMVSSGPLYLAMSSMVLKY